MDLPLIEDKPQRKVRPHRFQEIFKEALDHIANSLSAILMYEWGYDVSEFRDRIVAQCAPLTAYELDTGTEETPRTLHDYLTIAMYDKFGDDMSGVEYNFMRVFMYYHSRRRENDRKVPNSPPNISYKANAGLLAEAIREITEAVSEKDIDRIENYVKNFNNHDI